MVYGFQRQKSGLLTPSPGGLPGLQRQGMDQRKKLSGGELLGVTPNVDAGPHFTVTNSQRQATYGVGSWESIRGVLGRSSGVFYHEVLAVTLGGNAFIGWSDTALNVNNFMSASTGIGYIPAGSVNSAPGNATVASLTAYAQGDVIGLVVDTANKRGWFLKNGSAQNGDPVALTGGLDLSAALVGVFVAPAASLITTGDSFRFAFAAADFAFPMPSSARPWS